MCRFFHRLICHLSSCQSLERHPNLRLQDARTRERSLRILAPAMLLLLHLDWARGSLNPIWISIDLVPFEVAREQLGCTL